jgi:diaminopimelate decarboxylase
VTTAVHKKNVDLLVVDRVAALELENKQLRTALSSRIVIEQAKGVLAERFGLGLDDAFTLLRRAARSSRRRIHGLAAEVTTARETPIEIRRALPLFETRRREALDPGRGKITERHR